MQGKRFVSILLFLLFWPGLSQAEPGRITTVAGNGQEGFSGDGGPAAQASLSSPRRIAVDSQGNLFIADWDNHRVRKVDPNGTITTVAGNGQEGFSGDDGPATHASLTSPVDIAVGPADNLFITSFGHARIRKIDPNGTISTVAGNGQDGFSGDGGPATQASLSLPVGISIDGAGNLLIADYGNHRIRRVARIAAPSRLTPSAITADPLWTNTHRPRTILLAPNYPNPFNHSTVLPFQLDRPTLVRLDLFTTSGQRIGTLVDAFLPAGFHQFVWGGTSHQGQPVSTGIYLVRLRAGSYHQCARSSWSNRLASPPGVFQHARKMDLSNPSLSSFLAGFLPG